MSERLDRGQQLAVLQRAAEIDLLLEGGSSIDEIRSAAVESGISEQAVNEAIAELKGTRERRSSRSGVLKEWGRRTLFAGTGFVLGALADVLHSPNPFVSEPAPLMLYAYAMLTVLAYRIAQSEEDGHLRFQLSNAALFGGFALAWVDFAAVGTGSVLAWTFVFAVLSGGLGAARVARDSSGATLSERGEPGSA